MTTREEMKERILELLETVKLNDNAPSFPPRAVEIVKELAAFAKTTKTYQANQEAADSFWPPDTSPEEIYIFMLRKICGAPTTLHRDFSVLLNAPALERALTRKEMPVCQD